MLSEAGKVFVRTSSNRDFSNVVRGDFRTGKCSDPEFLRTVQHYHWLYRLT